MISSIDIVIALGSNLSSKTGTPLETISKTLRLLERRGVCVKRCSRWWRTPAFPKGTGPEFVNGAALISTDLDPLALLSTLHEVEAEIGRERRERWSSRVIDVDLIAYGDRVLPDEETVLRWIELSPEAAAIEAPGQLILPHPRLQERSFVLAPMRDIAPQWRHPLLQLTTEELAERLPRDAFEGVVPLDAP